MNFLYRNFLESKWCFYNGKDTKWLYNEEEAKEWYSHISKNMQKIKIKRPPNKIIEIQLPISDVECEEDKSLFDLIWDTKTEPRMAYVVNQILEEYYYWVDKCFHKRAAKKDIEWSEFWVLFAMREAIDWITRTSPIKIRASVEKETQKVSFVDWNISQNVKWAVFPYMWKKYTTDLYWVYTSKFRDAMFPDSDFWWFALQKRQRDFFIKRWRITVVMCSRWWGKSQWSTAFAATYLFKELNIKHEYWRPFLIVYGWLSKEANLQVVQYMLASAKKLTTNKNVLKWNAQDQTLTLYDWHNERKIKFVSQWQEWVWFRWLRPHLVVLDEAARLDKEMFTVAAGTAEAQIVLISTIDYTDRRKGFWWLFVEAQKKQKDYRDVYELIAELWIKHGMHKITTQEEYEKAVAKWVLTTMRDELWAERPIVWLKYTIDDIEYLSDAEKQRLIETSMMDWEDKCLAEYYSEYAESATVFNTEWLLESKLPPSFEMISLWFDEAEEHDNPAVVIAWVSWKMTYILHSEILNKDDYVKRYERINELMRDFQKKTSRPILFWQDLTRTQQLWMRETTELVREPDYPILYTPSQSNEEKRKRPFYMIWKRRLVTMVQEEYFKKWIIMFDWDLNTDWWLIEEISNFKYGNKWKIEWAKKKPDDQVNAMMVALFALRQWYIKDKFSVYDIAWHLSVDQRYDNVIMRRREQQQMIPDQQVSDILSDYR